MRHLPFSFQRQSLSFWLASCNCSRSLPYRSTVRFWRVPSNFLFALEQSCIWTTLGYVTLSPRPKGGGLVFCSIKFWLCDSNFMVMRIKRSKRWHLQRRAQATCRVDHLKRPCYNDGGGYIYMSDPNTSKPREVYNVCMQTTGQRSYRVSTVRCERGGNTTGISIKIRGQWFARYST